MADAGIGGGGVSVPEVEVVQVRGQVCIVEYGCYCVAGGVGFEDIDSLECLTDVHEHTAGGVRNPRLLRASPDFGLQRTQPLGLGTFLQNDVDGSPVTLHYALQGSYGLVHLVYLHFLYVAGIEILGGYVVAVFQ